MTFTEAVRVCFQKYLTVEGRARRAEYWWFVLFGMIANFLASLVDSLGMGLGSNIGIAGAIVSLALLIPSITVGGRRLHDRDMSAWWMLLILVPLIGFIVLLVLFVMRGTDGPNRFGPDPLNGGGGHREPETPDPKLSQSSIPKVGRD
ncbi:MAG: DUF805 domain-containing protein [Boseongicola sp.]|nr:MAG: DUF805 domain-containing protein [Boseongicola sp.]